MSINDELSMNEVAPEVIEDSRENIEEQVANFDFQDFLSKAARDRATVRLYSRGDLNQQATLVRTQLFEAMQRGQTVRQKQLAEKLDEITEAYFRQYLDFTLEESTPREQATVLRKIKEKGITDSAVQQLHLIAAQIVEPAGVRGEDLEDLANLIPSQIKLLVKAWQELQRIEENLPAF